MRVLTVCDRYNWGGASNVARSLHDMLLHNGHESIYLYGYDKRGFPAKTLPEKVVSASYLFGPHLNYLSYSVVGKNMFPVSDAKLDRLVSDSDLVHLHNIHDYAFDYCQIIDKVNKYDKPLAITCHDSWYITGRCSLPVDCNNWRNGCVKCAHKDYYHSSLIDRAAKERMKKLSKFKSVNRLIFVSPSNWLFDFLSEVYGEDRVIMISNSVDTTIFHYDVAIESTSASTNPVLLLVASDFQDRRKVDTKIVQTLIEEGVELHIAGANSPFTAANVVNHGRLAPMQLAKLMNVCNAHLFLSRIDNQPLVVLESLCSGMMQVSFKDKSVAGMGIENDCMFIENVTPEQLVSALSSNDFKEKISTEARQERAVKYQTLFSSDKMYVNYQRLYNSLISS